MLNIEEIKNGDNKKRPVKGRGSEKSKRPGAKNIITFNKGRSALADRARRGKEEIKC